MSNLINYSNGEMKISTFEEKMENANFPMSDKGRVYHVEVKRGEGMHQNSYCFFLKKK